ncbi:DUF4238 domain-containing protein [Embleya sp. NPDC005971]|uniref:DUF4238 domain-containing protein n=1 Tax=Embleya sp. NPDC005971 TaxID=3156724 RepID=UPI003411B041
MSGKKQHYLPAALIGGFGRLGPDRRARNAVVVYRTQDGSEVLESSASGIGYSKRMYRLKQPAPGMDPDRVEHVWRIVEPYLPKAIERAASGCETEQDRRVLVEHAAALGVRHPGFEASNNAVRTARGLPPLHGDLVHAARIHQLLHNQRALRMHRWRFLHSPPQARRFILNDRGYGQVFVVDDAGRQHGGTFLPLHPRLALLGWIAPSAGGFDHRYLRPNWVRSLNAVTWAHSRRFVVAHPDDAAMLRGQRSPARAQPFTASAFLGSEQSLFDDT